MEEERERERALMEDRERERERIECIATKAIDGHSDVTTEKLERKIE